MIDKVERNLSLEDRLLNKIMTYYSSIWQDRREDIETCKRWLDNFEDSSINNGKERTHALYLLSKFTYLGNIEMRELLKSLFRDLFKYPIIRDIRKKNMDTKDLTIINKKFNEELEATKFLGVGNPSESGVHLLYYFRQETNLSKEFFLNTHEIFNSTIEEFKDPLTLNINTRIKTELKSTRIKRYVFIDDFTGSGDQAVSYSTNIAEQIKHLDPSIEIYYFMLFATKDGISRIKRETKFDKVDAIFELDDTFKCFSDDSRYFKNNISEIEKTYCKNLCLKYGNRLFRPPLGHGDCQLLLAFFHNTPDNTLPIFWSENNWTPVFKRFNKKY